MLDRMLLSAGGEEKLYVEDVFSTYLYTGNGSTQTITNGIDLSGKGGMVWTKARSAANSNLLYDTARGATKYLISNATSASQTNLDTLASFNANGFTLGNSDGSNQSGTTGASWTFRKAPKFFDVVTWTGDGTDNRVISHNLGVAPGCILFKTLNTAQNWYVYHRSLAAPTKDKCLFLNNTESVNAASYLGADPTATTITLQPSGGSGTNAAGTTYVAYLFAHDATADGIIQCGSYTGNGSASGPTVTLGWEPQWLMIKNAEEAFGWLMFDNMRGMPVGSADQFLLANASNEEATYADAITLNPRGFSLSTDGGSVNSSGRKHIYIAIRRGPMKTPTVGTSVFTVNAGVNNTAEDGSITTLKNDLYIYRPYRTDVTSPSWLWADRLRGYLTAGAPILNSSTNDAESSRTTAPYIYGDGTAAQIFSPAAGNLVYRMARAPGFFDVVCYTGNGVAGRTVNHNLGVVPELVIIKNRSSTFGWAVVPFSFQPNSFMFLNGAGGISGSSGTITTASSTTVTLDNSYGTMNASGSNYVAYLFASCPGVSKVGSYTGNGSAQVINCGFSSGARFFLVKRTDSTGSWWVYDSARGIVAAADPALQLNNSTAEVTSADAVDTDSTGIIVNQEATCNINVNGATYIYLSVA